MSSRVARTFVDRETEQRRLHGLLASGTPHLALLTGRRRTGKTFLLTNTFDTDLAFFFTAARTSPEINRRQLLTDLERWSSEPIEEEDYPTWRSVFNLLLDLRTPDPLVVIIDEFQYLADDDRGLAEVASELNAAWEKKRAPRPLLFILSGSAVHTMEALAAGGAPLYGRFTWHHKLTPFDYWHAAELAPFPELRDRARCYGIFGGIPRYLAAIDPHATLEKNVTELLLSPSGEIRQLVETSLDQEEGLRDVPKYNGILRAVAAGQTERNEIAQRAGLSNDRALRDKLDRLVELGYLNERRNIDAKSNEPVRYGIADPAMRFHHRFVEPNASMLERVEPERVWRAAIADHLPRYMGHAFEPVAIQAYDRLQRERGLPLVRRWGRFEGRDREGASLEIDLVAPLVVHGVLTGAVKWDKAPIGAEVHYRHINMLERAARAGRKWAHEALDESSPLYYLAAGGFEEGFIHEVAKSGHQAFCWDLTDLYDAF